MSDLVKTLTEAHRVMHEMRAMLPEKDGAHGEVGKAMSGLRDAIEEVAALEPSAQEPAPSVAEPDFTDRQKPEASRPLAEPPFPRALVEQNRAALGMHPQRDYCPEKLKPGGCQLPNVHCAYPACNTAPVAPPQVTEAPSPREYCACMKEDCPKCYAIEAPSLGAPTLPGVCQPNGLMFDALGEPRVRYVRVSFDGAHCILSPDEVAAHKVAEEDHGESSVYTYTDVYLSEREFEDLPEFDGF